jgi:hypothetical protein
MALRVILGTHPTTGVKGLWISKPGIDATSSNDLTDFLFSPSRYNTRLYASGRVITSKKIAEAGTTNYSSPSGTRIRYYGVFQNSVVHNLGLIPLFYVQGSTSETSVVSCDTTGFFQKPYNRYYKSTALDGSDPQPYSDLPGLFPNDYDFVTHETTSPESLKFIYSIMTNKWATS